MIRKLEKSNDSNFGKWPKTHFGPNLDQNQPNLSLMGPIWVKQFFSASGLTVPVRYHSYQILYAKLEKSNYANFRKWPKTRFGHNFGLNRPHSGLNGPNLGQKIFLQQ